MLCTVELFGRKKICFVFEINIIKPICMIYGTSVTTGMALLYRWLINIWFDNDLESQGFRLLLDSVSTKIYEAL